MAAMASTAPDSTSPARRPNPPSRDPASRMTVELIALRGIPIVRPGDDLAALIRAAAPSFAAGDVLVVAQKIVSKAEDRFVDLATVTPSPEAERLARETDKDPRLVELILGESQRVLR